MELSVIAPASSGLPSEKDVCLASRERIVFLAVVLVTKHHLCVVLAEQMMPVEQLLVVISHVRV